MNFFGHAALACWQRSDPVFVLGSMLPDFASMMRARLPALLDADVAAGVSFHHATDRVFHELDGFRALNAGAFSWLSERGLGRGSARAVAHVGIEILLDTALAEDESACSAYVSALDWTESEHGRGLIDWGDGGVNERFARLCKTLHERGVVRADAAPEYVAFRVRRALAGRPRLELDETGETVVRNWVIATRSAVVERAPRLIADLKAKLVPESTDTSR